MDFKNILSKEQILFFEEDLEYEELLKKSVEHLKKLYNIPYNLGECVNGILERDTLGSTAFDEGFAIPHIRLEKISGVHMLIVKTKHKITVPQPCCNKNINVFAIYLTSKSSPNLYLGILSSTIKLFNFEKGKYLKEIQSSNNIDDIYNIFLNSNIEIKHKLAAADIMEHRTLTIYPDINIKEAISHLYKHQESIAYVTDENNKLLGYISITLILKNLISEIMDKDIDNIDIEKFNKECKSFITLLEKGSNLKAKDIMNTIDRTITPESPILDAIYYLAKSSVDIPVVSDGILKGVISAKNLLNKILII